MGELEEYLTECSEPFGGVAIDGHLKDIEDFYASLYSSLENGSVHRGLVIRDKGRVLGRLSFLITKPSVSAMRFVSRKEYERHPADFREPTLDACEFIADKFRVMVNTSLLTYMLIEEGYRLSERNWIVRGYGDSKEVNSAYSQAFLKRVNGRLVHIRELRRSRDAFSERR